ncbi:MAG: CoA-binding protein [Bacteroidetes bacterium]|nr:MAG: CoA-binding protein [Bacteroidota bacterium]
MPKKTLVLGAAPDAEKYAYKATVMLKEYGHPVVPFGIKKGYIGNLKITNELPEGEFDTVTLYIGPPKQQAYFDYLVKLKPKRVIFNPGTENLVLENLLERNEIEPVIACTLVLLRTGQY